MQDFEDRMKERWQQRRKKAYNWQKLLLMALVLVAIWYTMARLQNADNIVSTPSASSVDSLAKDAEQNP
jgi:ABC-type nitrate/sulfonate/bicarbonate transport system permease component